MKVIIEKKLETLKDLKIAKKNLRKKARKQEAKLVEQFTEVKSELNPKRIYSEVLDSFNVNNLLLELLPYALRYQNQLTDNLIIRKLASIDKKKLPVLIGSITAVSFFAYAYFTKSKNTQKPSSATPPTSATNEDMDEFFV